MNPAVLRLDKDNQSNVMKYNDNVFDFLIEKSRNIHSKEDLYSIQFTIEKKTMDYNTKSLVKAYPDFINMMIGDGKQSAKDDVLCMDLTADERTIVNNFDTYCMEGIMVYVFSLLFHP